MSRPSHKHTATRYRHTAMQWFGPATLLIALWGLVGCDAIISVNKDYYQVVPPGWEGPHLVLNSIAEPNPCPEGFSETARLHNGNYLPQTGPICSCEAPPEACSPVLREYDFSGGPCTDPRGPPESFPAGVCHPVQLPYGYVRVRKPVLEESSCVAQEQLLAEPQWALNARVCSGKEGNCISRPGEHSCPEGFFTEPHPLFQSHLDTRSCDCGQVQGVCEGTTGIINPDALPGGLTSLQACEMGFVTAIAGDNECVGPLQVDYIKYALSEVELACSVSNEDALIGKVTPASPITICCQL